jgi:hypothetical protein
MGYVLLALPLRLATDPAADLEQLREAARHRGRDPLKEARKRRIVNRLLALEPQLQVLERDAPALARALPELPDDEISLQARTVDLAGWPGVSIELADDWAWLEVAAWDELASADMQSRLARILRAIADDTGWALVDAERGTAGTADALAKRALEVAAAWRAATEAAQRTDAGTD